MEKRCISASCSMLTVWACTSFRKTRFFDLSGSSGLKGSELSGQQHPTRCFTLTMTVPNLIPRSLQHLECRKLQGLNLAVLTIFDRLLRVSALVNMDMKDSAALIHTNRTGTCNKVVSYSYSTGPGIYGSKPTRAWGRSPRTRAVYVAINPWQLCYNYYISHLIG